MTLAALADAPYIPLGPPISTPVPGAESLARSLAIDLARQRVLAETATSKNQQQRLDQAFSAIKAFEHSHGPVTQLRDIKGSCNDLDKISVAANIRRNSSSQFLADHGHGLTPDSPNDSFTGKPHMTLPARLPVMLSHQPASDKLSLRPLFPSIPVSQLQVPCSGDFPRQLCSQDSSGPKTA